VRRGLSVIVDVRRVDWEGLSFQSFAGIILTGDRSRKGIDQSNHSGIK
jgi:hypothetical protein